MATEFMGMVIEAEFDPKTTDRSFKKIAQTFEKASNKAFARAIETGVRPGIWKKQAKAIAALQAKVAKAGTDKTAKAQVVAMEKLYKKEFGWIDQATKRRAKAIQELGKKPGGMFSGASIAKFGASLGSAVNDVMSGNLNTYAKLIKKIGEGTGKAGLAVQAKQGGGVGGKAAQGMGGLMKGIAKAMAPIAAMAAGFAAVVAMIFQADAAAKDLNRSLLSSGVSVGDMAVGLKGVSGALDKMRDAFVTADGAWDFNRLWGTTAEDHFKILGAYSEFGHTLKKISANAKDAGDEMKRLRDATATALTYHKLTGMAAEDLAGKMGGYMEEMGASLEHVREGFASVYEAAQLSGFGTKRFFGMVLQATSGMSMLNVRFDETAGLLLRMSKVLGTTAAAGMLGGLGKGMKGKDIAGRMKQAKQVGEGTSQEILQIVGEQQSKDFLAKLGDTVDIDKLGDRLADEGLAVDLKDPKKFGEAVGKMSLEDQNRLLGVMAEEAGDDGQMMVKHLAQMTDLLRGGQKGGLGNIAMGMGQAGQAGELLMDLNMVKGFISEPLHKLNALQIQAAATATGKSVEQIEMLKMLSGRIVGGFDTLTKETEGMVWAVKEGGEDGKKSFEERNKQLASAYGMFITEQGEWLTAANAEDYERLQAQMDKMSDEDRAAFVEANKVQQTELGVQAAMTKAQAKTEEEAKETFDKHLAVAQQTALATTNLSVILKQGMQVIMEKIYAKLQQVFAWISSEDKESRANRMQMVGELQDNKQVLADSIKKGSEDVGSLKAHLAGLDPKKDKEEVKRVQEEIEKHMAALQSNQMRSAHMDKLIDEVSNMSGPMAIEFWKNAPSSEEFMAKAMGGAGMTKYLKRAGKGGKGQEEYQKGSELWKSKKAEMMASDPEKYVASVIKGLEKMAQQGGLTGQSETVLKQMKMYMESGQVSKGNLGSLMSIKSKSGGSAVEEMEEQARIAVAHAFQYEEYQKSGVSGVGFDSGTTYGGNITGAAAQGAASLQLAGTGLDRRLGQTVSEGATVMGAAKGGKTKEQLDKEAAKKKEKFDKKQMGAKNQAEAVAKGVVKGNKETEVAKITSTLRSGGVKGNLEKWAKSLQEGRGAPSKLKEALVKANTNLQALGLPAANDMVMQIGQGGVKFAQRVDPGDVGVFSKPGGALAGAGGGGGGGRGTTNHFYNDGPGIFKSINKFRKVMGDYA